MTNMQREKVDEFSSIIKKSTRIELTVCLLITNSNVVRDIDVKDSSSEFESVRGTRSAEAAKALYGSSSYLRWDTGIPAVVAPFHGLAPALKQLIAQFEAKMGSEGWDAKYSSLLESMKAQLEDYLSEINDVKNGFREWLPSWMVAGPKALVVDGNRIVEFEQWLVDAGWAPKVRPELSLGLYSEAGRTPLDVHITLGFEPDIGGFSPDKVAALALSAAMFLCQDAISLRFMNQAKESTSLLFSVSSTPTLLKGMRKKYSHLEREIPSNLEDPDWYQCFTSPEPEYFLVLNCPSEIAREKQSLQVSLNRVLEALGNSGGVQTHAPYPKADWSALEYKSAGEDILIILRGRTHNIWKAFSEGPLQHFATQCVSSQPTSSLFYPILYGWATDCPDFVSNSPSSCVLRFRSFWRKGIDQIEKETKVDCHCAGCKDVPMRDQEGCEIERYGPHFLVAKPTSDIDSQSIQVRTSCSHYSCPSNFIGSIYSLPLSLLGSLTKAKTARWVRQFWIPPSLLSVLSQEDSSPD